MVSSQIGVQYQTQQTIALCAELGTDGALALQHPNPMQRSSRIAPHQRNLRKPDRLVSGNLRGIEKR